MNELLSGKTKIPGRVGALARAMRIAGRLSVVAGLAWLAGDATAKLWSLTQGRPQPIQRRMATVEDSHDSLLAQIATTEALWSFHGMEGGFHQANLSTAELDRRWDKLSTRHGETADAYAPCSAIDGEPIGSKAQQGRLSVLEKNIPTGRIRLLFHAESGQVICIAIATPSAGDRWSLLQVSRDEIAKSQTPREPLLPFPEPVRVVVERGESSRPASLQVIEVATGDEAVLNHWKAMGWQCAVSLNEHNALLDVRLSRGSERSRAAKIGAVRGNFWLLMRDRR